MSSLALPGEIVCSGENSVPWVGSYSNNSHIYASLAGKVELVSGDFKQRVCITQKPDVRHCAFPKINSSVLARVTRLDSRKAVVEILCVSFYKNGNEESDMVAVKEPYPGIIRVEDVRATERDLVRIHDCFQPGDVVRARVHSYGDSHSYLLSTAANDLGVIHALSKTTNIPMIPQSWQTMVCPRSGIVEKRKCAKP